MACEVRAVFESLDIYRLCDLTLLNPSEPVSLVKKIRKQNPHHLKLQQIKRTSTKC